MFPISRRHFLATAGVALLPAVASAIDPIKRPSAKPDLKLSVAAYGFRDVLDLKKPKITLFDFIDMAAEWPVEAVELTSYYFAETTDAYLDKLRAAAAKRKLTAGKPVAKYSNNLRVKTKSKPALGG